MEDSNDFDLIVIGSGSGLDVANAAAHKGLRVALIRWVVPVLIGAVFLLSY